MLRRLFILLLLFNSFQFVSQTNVHYLSSVTIDGNKEEWSENYILKNCKQKNTKSKNSNSYIVYASWNEENLFLFIEVEDNNLISLKKNDQKALYLNDALEIYIDPLNDSKKTMDVNDYQFIVSVDKKSIILKGDKHLLEDSSYLAPKESGTSTLLFDYALQLHGNVNDRKKDKGYSLECCIPFAGIGVRPKENHQFKLDICMDDADKFLDIRNFSEDDEISEFFYSSWNDSRDFSIPETWSLIRLEGKPSTLKAVFKLYYIEIISVALLIFFFLLTLIVLLKRKNNQLKSLPQFKDLQTSTLNLIDKKDANFQETKTIKFSTEQLSIDHPLIQKGRIYILNNIDKEISVEELSEHLALSTRSLQRQMKDLISLAPNHFITIVKMEEARKLLVEKKLNVNEIAYRLGYSDVSYFGKLFKRYYDVTPKQFSSNN